MALSSVVSWYRVRVQGLGWRGIPVLGVVGANLLVLLAGVYIYCSGGDESVVFAEHGWMTFTDSAQLALGGVAGMIAWWLVIARRRRMVAQDVKHIAFWGLSGAALIYFAADDFFGIHEAVGLWLEAQGAIAHRVTNSTDDLVILAMGCVGLVALWWYRTEFVAARHSSTLIALAVPLAVLMTLLDAWGYRWLRALEFPVQVVACGLLMSAYCGRLFEVVNSALSPTLSSNPAATANPAAS